MTASWLSGPPSATIAGSWKASDERSAIERHNPDSLYLAQCNLGIGGTQGIK
jgi:hypothetical protein